MADLALAVAGKAGIVADVLVFDRRNPELCAIVYDFDRGRRFDRVRVLIPEYLRRGRTLRLTVKDYRVAQDHVDHLFGGYRESWWRCNTF